MSLTAGAVLGALALDLVVGEPATRWHPVAWFGRVVGRFDREPSRPRAAGIGLAIALPLLAALVAGLVVLAFGRIDPRLGLVAGTLGLFVATSFRALLAAVHRVGRLASEDLPTARSELRALAGRDASALDADAVRSAALESLVENLADGLVGPLAAFAAGAFLGTGLGLGAVAALALACAGASWLKAVNTMDSMLGYRHRPLGFGAARADDVAMWLPARLTAGLLAAWYLSPRALARAATWTSDVASPNAGWPMGVLAAAANVRLEKPGHYVLNPDGARPTGATVAAAVRRVGLAGLSAYAVAGVIAWY